MEKKIEITPPESGDAPIPDTFLSGLNAMRRERWNEAAAAFEARLESAGTDAERCACMRYLGRCRAKMGDAALARVWLSRAIEEAPLLREPYIEMAKFEESAANPAAVLRLAEQAIRLDPVPRDAFSEAFAIDGTVYDLAAHACLLLGRKQEALSYQQRAAELSPDDERIARNLLFIRDAIEKEGEAPPWRLSQRLAKKLNLTTPGNENGSGKLAHTLLFMLRNAYQEEDLKLAETCLKSMEKSAHKTVVVYNQGFWNNSELERYLSKFALDCVVIGDGENAGIVAGRQRCFDYIRENLPDTQFITELHLDMVFTDGWEGPLVEFLRENDDPMVSCGIVTREGFTAFLNENAGPVPTDPEELDRYLNALRRDRVVNGFTHPVVHRAQALYAVGGYHTAFFTGKQDFEDDSLLLGYYYYMGTKANWRPKINWNSVAYHAIAAQRLTIPGDRTENLNGLGRQYGALGFYHLARLHESPWHRQFFGDVYRRLSQRGK